MKRQIALLMSIIMILSCLPASVLKAAPMGNALQFEVHNQQTLELKQDGMVLSNLVGQQEEATMSFNVASNGEYKLTYYIDGTTENPTETSKVEVTFNVGVLPDVLINQPVQTTTPGATPTPDYEEANKIFVTVKVFNEAGNEIELSARKYIMPYNGTYESFAKSPYFLGEIRKAGQSGAVAKSEKEFAVTIGANLNLRFKYDNNTMYFRTDCLQKGYLYNFNLQSGNKEATQLVFTGISGLRLKPVHIDETHPAGPEVTKIEEPTDIKAGTKPGFKFEMDDLKVLDANGKYVPIMGTANLGDNLTATLSLNTKLEENDTSKEDMQVIFKVAENAEVTGPAGTNIGSNKKIGYDASTGKAFLYFTKKEYYTTKLANDIAWDKLEPSMVLGGSVTISGKINIAGKDITIDPIDATIDTGYTFVEYTPTQKVKGETTLTITPYKYKGEVVYNVYLFNGNQDLDIENGNFSNKLFGSYKYTYDDAFRNRKLEISIPNSNPASFLIEAVFSGNNSVRSQLVYYNTTQVTDFVPYTPQIRDVSNIYVVEEKENKNEALAAGFTLTWSAPTKEKLVDMLEQNGAVYFEVKMQPVNTEVGKQETIAVFEATLDGTGNRKTIKMRSLDDNYKGEVSYDEEDNMFVAKHVPVKVVGESNWRRIVYNTTNDDYLKQPQYPAFNKDLAANMAPSVGEWKFDNDTNYFPKIPNSFYLTIRAIHDTNLDPTDTKALLVGSESNRHPVTLDKTIEYVPAPFEFNKTVANNDITIDFNNVNLANFRDYRLTPTKWNIVDSEGNQAITTSGNATVMPGVYEIVLYQDSYMDKENKKQTNDFADGVIERLLDSTKAEDKIYKWELSLNKDNQKIDFKDSSVGGSTQALEALRQGKIVSFSYVSDNMNGEGVMPITFKGLDPNQSYYLKVRTVVRSERDPEPYKDGDKKRVDYSLFSKAFGFTAPTVSKPVEPGEERPSTPHMYTAEAIDSTSAVLKWTMKDLKTYDGKNLKFEIIRTTEQRIPEELLKDFTLTTDEIIENLKEAKVFTEADYKRIDDIDDLYGEIGYYELTDTKLVPNTVYYYYIRTKLGTINSEWIYQPVTTKNIDKPILLKAYNSKKTSFDISFLSKFQYSEVPSKYDFKIMIQDENSNEWREVTSANYTRIRDNETTVSEDGYYFYEYRINNLIPGKRYNIKVAAVDKTKEMIDGEYQQSLYTDVVMIRTEYDQDAADKENKYQEYLTRFDQEVEKLKRKPYWSMSLDSTYKYRAEYLLAEMANNGTYDLVSGANSDEAVYYFPANVISKMNSSGTSFNVKLQNASALVRPRTILDTNPVVKEAVEQVTRQLLKDYYVKLTVRLGGENTVINAEAAISPEITVEMEVVHMDSKDMIIESDAMISLEKIIEEERLRFIDRLEADIKDGKILDEQLNNLLSSSTKSILREHAREFSKIMNRAIKHEYTINQIDKSILVAYQTDKSAVKAYYNAGRWTEVSVIMLNGNSVGLEAKELGVYVFTGRAALITNAPTLAPFQNFITTYGLDEFFKLTSDTSIKVEKYQLYGSLARILGAPKGSDYVSYLQSKGFKGVRNSQLNKTVTQEEAIYLIMQGYEVLKRKNVNQIVINNKNCVRNIASIQEIYRPYVYAAVQLNVVTPINGKIVPNDKVSVPSVIKMLEKITK